MTHDYRYNPNAAWMPAVAWVVLVLASAVGAAFRTGFEQVLMALIAALGVAGLLGVLPLIFDRRVQLSIGPKGIMYRPFSPQTIPWSDVKAVATVHTTTPLGPMLRVLWTRELRTNSINFDVIDAGAWPRGIPLYRTSARMMNAAPRPIYPINLNHLQWADEAVVVAQIKRYWKDFVPTFEVLQTT